MPVRRLTPGGSWLNVLAGFPDVKNHNYVRPPDFRVAGQSPEIFNLGAGRSAEGRPEHDIGTYCDLNITLVMEFGVFLVGFSVLPRCRQSAFYNWPVLSEPIGRRNSADKTIRVALTPADVRRA